MNDQGLSSDIISTLPQHIIENIFSLMPIRDALRTSIWSSKWRYCWMTIPILVFYDNQFEEEPASKHLKKQNFVDAIFHVLLLHKGPMLELNLYVDKDVKFSKFDQIILHLSKRNDLKRLNIDISNSFYDLPSSFFSLQGLQELELSNCYFELPLTFNGFRSLRKLWFHNVEVPEKMLQRFLSNCPIVKEVLLTGCAEEFANGNNFTFVEFLQCAPLIANLDLSNCYMKFFATGGMPQKLPTSLVHLKYLSLDVCLMEQDEISLALCIIRSSPRIQEITFVMYDNMKLPAQQTSVDFLDPQDYMDLNLDHLEELKIQKFSNLPLEWDFVTLIMAKSPVLDKTLIELNDNVSVDEELMMLRELIELPFPRSSPSAKLKFERPKPSS